MTDFSAQGRGFWPQHMATGEDFFTLFWPQDGKFYQTSLPWGEQFDKIALQMSKHLPHENMVCVESPNFNATFLIFWFISIICCSKFCCFYCCIWIIFIFVCICHKCYEVWMSLQEHISFIVILPNLYIKLYLHTEYITFRITGMDNFEWYLFNQLWIKIAIIYWNQEVLFSPSSKWW